MTDPRDFAARPARKPRTLASARAIRLRPPGPDRPAYWNSVRLDARPRTCNREYVSITDHALRISNISARLS